jgi:hypothetical protein
LHGNLRFRDCLAPFADGNFIFFNSAHFLALKLGINIADPVKNISLGDDKCQSENKRATCSKTKQNGMSMHISIENSST